MPCYTPLHGWKSKSVNLSGKRSIVFNRNDALIDMPVVVPCGGCIGCRLARSKTWAIRCCHEAYYHEKTCFVTLTYSDGNIPLTEDGLQTLDVSHFQKFMKRLRKKFGEGVRFFHCGEYGELLERPHYHVCLFGVDFEDKYPWSIREDVVLYRSETLEKLWPFGFSTVGELTFQSVAYTARYILKKVRGKDAEKHYVSRRPEYVTMSRRPGLGHRWITEFMNDVYPHDYVVSGLKNTKFKPPRYYDTIYDLTFPGELDNLKSRRKREAKRRAFDETAERLAVRQECQVLKASRLRREFESKLNNSS